MSSGARCRWRRFEMSDDIPVGPSSTHEIERLAEGWRHALDDEDKWAPDILALIDKAGSEFKAVQGLRVVPLPDEEMGDDEARAESNPPRIYIRASLEAAAPSNTPRI